MYVAGFDIKKRSLADGSLVTGFGTGGVFTFITLGNTIAIDSTYIYVVGRDNSTGNAQWRIEKEQNRDWEAATGFCPNVRWQAANPSLMKFRPRKRKSDNIGYSDSEDSLVIGNGPLASDIRRSSFLRAYMPFCRATLLAERPFGMYLSNH